MNLFNSDAIQFVLYFVVPGVVAVAIHDSMVASERRNWQEMSLVLVTYGVINLFIFSLLSLLIQFLPVFQISLLIVPQKVDGTALIFLDLLIPVGMAFLSVHVRRSRFVQQLFRGIFLDPIPAPWDHIFSNRYKCYCLIFHMKDGSTLAGVYGASSRVSSFPHPKEVYVEQLCSLDAQGGVIDRVPGSSGALISMDECSFVELVELPTAQLAPLIQRSNLWQKIRSPIRAATSMKLFSRYSKGLFSRRNNQQSSVNSMAHLSNQPQTPSLSTTGVPTSQVQVPTVQQHLPNQHQQLIQGSPAQAQSVPPPASPNKRKAAN
jgi:Family of unknown function (DUF6338)